MKGSIPKRLLFLALAAAPPGCGSQPDAVPPAAVVSNLAVESDLNTVVLSLEAEARLGIETALAERREVTRSREIGGEVFVPFEREIIVAAPVAGTVRAPESGTIPRTGSLVKRGDIVMRLVFLPSGQDLTQASERVRVAEASAAAARREAARADSLIRERFITAREHEIATTALATAEAELRSARAGAALLDGREPAREAELTSMAVTAPSDGVLWQVWVTEQQTVASAAPLFEVIDPDPAWVRVPVYAGDAAAIDRTRPAMLRLLGTGTEAGREARPVRAPPSADPLSASIDLFYEVPNRDGALRPQQRLAVTVPLRESEEALVVPWTAVLYDASGGTWVYTVAGPRTYTRQRIELKYVSGNLAVLGRGPAPGTAVVTVGAAELFGTEFGNGK